MNKVDAQKYIRLAAADGRVNFTGHAEIRMVERGISRKMVWDALLRGRVNRKPEPNLAKGSLECRLDHYCAGERYGELVGIPDGNPNVFDCYGGTTGLRP